MIVADLTKGPSKKDALTAARSFLKFWETHRNWTQSDFLMRLGRLYEFPEGTPKYDGPWSAGGIAAFIQSYAREIE